MNCKKCELNNHRITNDIQKKHCKRCMSTFYMSEAEKYCEERLKHAKEIVIDLAKAYEYNQVNTSAAKELKKFLNRDSSLVSSIGSSSTVNEIFRSPNIKKLNKALEDDLKIVDFPNIACKVYSPKSGNTYKVTLNSCQCTDFSIHKRPCKHMYRLAMALGIINHTKTSK